MNARRSSVLLWTLVLLAAPLLYILFQSYVLDSPAPSYAESPSGVEEHVALLEQKIRKLEQTLEQEHQARERAERALRSSGAEPEPSSPTTAETTDGYRYKLSSGLFSIPENAKSVDWAVTNNSEAPQTYRVTVYEAGVKMVKKSDGGLTMDLEPFESSHNANSVGYEQPFRPGFYYEVIVETNSRKLLPSVQVWSNHGNAVIPGTLIGPGHFVNLVEEPSSEHVLYRFKNDDDEPKR